MVLKHFPVRKDIVGIGLSDWSGYADILAEKLSYTNTYYHQDPLLDITAPGASYSNCDFVISSDVFEHVHSPVQRAFDGTKQLLKPGGAFIFTVPFTNTPSTVEHFSEFSDVQLVRFGDDRIVVGRRPDGSFGIRTDLVFHGGVGDTLEMRVFCRTAVERHLEQAGFSSIQVFSEDEPGYGIIHKHPWSLPFTAVRT